MLTDIVSRFLLASLSIETILQEVTKYRRRQKLSAIESGLDFRGAYEIVLGRIEAQGEKEKSLGMAALMWISHSERPLKVDELCHAIAIEIGSNDLDNDDIPAISTLIDCCQGLIIIDNSTSTVMLIHYTLQEYLRTLPGLSDGAHSTMAEICLTYLNFQHIKDLPASTPSDPRGTHFLEYSSLYWGAHMRMEPSDDAKQFALKLLDQFDAHRSAKSLWDSVSWEFALGRAADRKPFSALHCISYFGIIEVADALIGTKKWDVNERGSAGMTPLIWAARYGHEEIVRLLLREKHIQLDQKDANYGRTALSWAAENGREGVVRLLLGPRFINPGSIGHRWGKARRVAGQPLGRRYANPDSSSRTGRTPLSWAAENGHEGTVKLLVRRGDVDPNSSDRYGRTPLLWAARNGHEKVVKLLLGRKDLNPDVPDTGHGQTPLSWASGNKHRGVVELLLKRNDVNPNGLAESGRTPLF